MHDWQVGTVAAFALIVAEMGILRALGEMRELLQRGSERPPAPPPARP
jgi:hypothetical protein